MGAIMTNADRDNIVVQAVAYGKPNTLIAKELGWADSTVFNVLRCLELVKDNNWKEVVNKVKSSCWSSPLIEWAANRCGVQVPQIVYDADKERQAKRKGANKVQAVEPVPDPPEEAKPANDTLFLVKVLENLDALVKSNNEILAAMGEVLKELRPVEQKARQ